MANVNDGAFSLTPNTPDLSLQMTRDIALSPEQCFAAWTQPALIQEWFCPKPWRVIACTVDLKPGGLFATTMQSPEGKTQPEGLGCYLLTDSPHRLVWTNLMGPGFVPQSVQHPGFGFVCDLRFDALPHGMTRYHATVHHTDQAGRDAHAAMGFEQGWNIALDQLVALMG